MLLSNFCDPRKIAKLWAEKDLLDDLFDSYVSRKLGKLFSN